MRVLLTLFATAAVYASTPAPTVPTPFPTQTPAPESLCTYASTDAGPFALDCLQQEFINQGCSIRGDSYPTNTRVATNDKAWYNANTWGDVQTQMAAVQAAGGTACTGGATNYPSPMPSPEPTTQMPTPQPTLIPTSSTPAPTYGANAAWVPLSGDTPSALQTECEARGFNREYDDTEYVIRISTAGGDDYYTTSGEICDILGDVNDAAGLSWSDRSNGPFQTVTVQTGPVFEVIDSSTGPDGRMFSHWDSNGSAGGYASVNPAGGNYAGAYGQSFSVAITSLRTNEPCRERMSPNAANTFDSPAFSSPCSRGGTTGQVWDDSAPLCTGASDNSALLYAIGNRQFGGTCDSKCVFGMDYEQGVGSSGSYWFWVAGADNCWKAKDEYFAGEFQYCNADDAGFSPNGIEQQQYDQAMVERSLLCKERCNMADGWVYASGSCYRVAHPSDYSAQGQSGNPANGVSFCASVSSDPSATFLASVGSASENAVANALCGAATGQCYFGGMTGVGQGSGAWADGSQVTWTNWETNESDAAASGNAMVMLADGTWTYYWSQRSIGVLCETAADTDMADSSQSTAETCALASSTASAQLLNTQSYPSLDVAASGFTDSSAPGNLHIVVEVPKTMYNARIGFENSTNDAADYSWEWDNSYWSVTGAAGGCSTPYTIEGAIPWTTFNLGGAGGVERLATFEENTASTAVGANVRDTQDELAADGSGVYYQFGAIVRIEATQPIFTKVVDHLGAARVKREARMDRDVVVRVPFVLRFQKTVTVTTDVNIVSTKYNYKTVAAIIQSIQHSTQYFQPPYAQIQMQIRTKSQYPYMFDTDTSLANLHVASTAGNPGTTVDLSLDWLSNDVNCTFTNSDHNREGDICTQEWMLHIVPADNVCYATGEYSVELTTDCFIGKDVCYRPVDSNGADIDTVTFTFKVQTSKFCPTMADEVDLTGSMVVTGRESFKPTLEGVEEATAGQLYMQGETIHVLATTASSKASITNTEIAMVELRQDFGSLVQTGYNRVPYDSTFEDKTIWMRAGAGARVATGTVSVDDGQSVTSGIVLMSDAGVFTTGDDPCSVVSCTFGATEAGFTFNLHSRAMPVNVDSFGTKTLVATLEVTYESLNANAVGRRRRLLQNSPSFDMRAQASFGTMAWKPASVPKGLGATASMSLELTLSSTVDRSNVLSFSQAVHTAFVQSLNADPSSYNCYDSQVSVDRIFSGGISIWNRPQQGQMSSRRLMNVPQKLKIEFTFANSNKANAMPLTEMIAIFDKQLRNPASPLLNQPLLAGAVVHSVQEITTSSYTPTENKLASSAFMAVPSLFALLALLW